MSRLSQTTTQQRGAGTKVRYFVRHLVEMFVAMGIGMVVLGMPYVWIAGSFGYAHPFSQLPEVSALVMAFNMALPMAVWMRYRGMEWGPIAEMSGAMFVEAILLIVVCSLGILAKSSLMMWQHLLMLPAMLIPMLLRLDVYTGHACH